MLESVATIARAPGRSSPLAAALADALDGRGAWAGALERCPGPDERDDGATERDELLALGLVHDLFLAPLDRLQGRERHQHHPVLLEVKARLEARLRRRVEGRTGQVAGPDDDAAAEVRRVAASDMLPEVYGWVADTASWDELVRFLSWEGGPDAGFDDLVALAQVGVTGVPKVSLGANYWDEMGRGDPAAVHTVLHERLVAATAMATPDPWECPIGTLERPALNGFLATNRVLQPEFLGALGLVELQAGPRCRAVVRGMERLGAPPDAVAFYAEHAAADPVHGRDWLDRVVTPLASRDTEVGRRIARGARWRRTVNRRFFDEAARRVHLGG